MQELKANGLILCGSVGYCQLGFLGFVTEFSVGLRLSCDTLLKVLYWLASVLPFHLVFPT